MPSRRSSRPQRRSGGVAAPLAIGVLVIGFGAIALQGDLPAKISSWFASGAEGELALAPAPRQSSAPSAAAPAQPLPMAQMQSAIASTSDTVNAATWPALPPQALLDQAASLGDRALKDTEFDRPPWQRFARPAAPIAGRTVVAILVTGLGKDRSVTAAAIAGLPAEVSLSFDPYAPDLADWIAAARAFGHEAMLDLPMQGKDFPARDPGPLGLLVGLNDGEMARRIDAVATGGPDALGFATADGDAFLMDDHATATMLGEVARLGLGFVDASDQTMSLSPALSTPAGVASARAAVRLDSADSRGAVAERLAVAAQTAIEHGSVLAVAPASPTAIVGIADWARQQSADGPALVPVSALLQK